MSAFDQEKFEAPDEVRDVMVANFEKAINILKGGG